jgi:hypothetical protein
MTYTTILALADELVPNPFSDNVKLLWLNQIAREVEIDLFLGDPEEFEEITAQTLSTREIPEHTRPEMYVAWMKAMYYWAMGEYEIYQNEKAMFESLRSDLAGRLCELYHVGTGGPEHEIENEEE